MPNCVGEYVGKYVVRAVSDHGHRPSRRSDSISEYEGSVIQMNARAVDEATELSWQTRGCGRWPPDAGGIRRLPS